MLKPNRDKRHKEIQATIDTYLSGRHELLVLGEKYKDLIDGNDNIIGRIGEFIALQFLEMIGQMPRKASGKSNKGYDLVDGDILTQVKVMTEENIRGRNVRLKDPWNQLVLVELGASYIPKRIGLLTKSQHMKARNENETWSEYPIVKRTMLSPRGLIGTYGRVYTEQEIMIYTS